MTRRPVPRGETADTSEVCSGAAGVRLSRRDAVSRRGSRPPRLVRFALAMALADGRETRRRSSA
eukprot:2499001-Prymnesium_polylepis.2